MINKKIKLYAIFVPALTAILTAAIPTIAADVTNNAFADTVFTSGGAKPTAGTDVNGYWPQLVGAQYTWVRQYQSSFAAPYSGPLSLNPTGDVAGTHTVGAYFGWRLTDTLQAYVDIEKFMGAGVSGSTGLAGLTNGDVVRQGSNNLKKRPYVARRYLRYVVPLSKDMVETDRAMDQLGGKEAATRFEFKVGTMALNDDFDKNRYANSTRTQFMNWSLWNNGAWDFGADTRGYTNGIVAGYISPKWSLKAGIHQMPSEANGQDLDAPVLKARSENLELTLSPADGGLVLRLLAYRNLARMGNYRDAIDAAATARRSLPDIRTQDKDRRKKTGFGLNVERPLADDGETGLFLRAGWNDGRTESFAFTEIDQTITLGGQLSGAQWGRGDDRLAIAYASNGLSRDHRDYLKAGGSGFVLADDALNYGREQIIEAYYRIGILKHLQLSPDVQYIRNPGMNTDRGPVTFVGFRLHLEY